MLKTQIFRNETNLRKSVLLAACQNGLFQIAKLSVYMWKKGHFLWKNLQESFMRKCQTFIFKRLFSEFDYLFFFWSYVVTKCCKRDETYRKELSAFLFSRFRLFPVRCHSLLITPIFILTLRSHSKKSFNDLTFTFMFHFEVLVSFS